MQEGLNAESENVGVYAGGSRESGELLNERLGCELERALSQGREARLGKQARGRNATGAGKKGRMIVVCERCGRCWQGSKMVSITDGR